MQKIDAKSLLAQTMNPKMLPVMLKKLQKRFFDGAGSLSIDENLDWLRSNCTSFSSLAQDMDATLWAEAEEVSNKLEIDAKAILDPIGILLGGGGVYPFLYFLTRYLKPSCIVETGVAAGFSSSVFLSAIKVNQKGRLYSSDFPYFRIQDPEKYIGIVVEQSLKSDWALYIDGDEANIPKILDQVKSVDIFHYDSDKSYSGRKFVMEKIESRMSPNGIILMDDIQDNSYFHDYLKLKNITEWKIFEFQGKYVGMIGGYFSANFTLFYKLMASLIESDLDY